MVLNFLKWWASIESHGESTPTDRFPLISIKRALYQCRTYSNSAKAHILYAVYVHVPSPELKSILYLRNPNFHIFEFFLWNSWSVNSCITLCLFARSNSFKRQSLPYSLNINLCFMLYYLWYMQSCLSYCPFLRTCAMVCLCRHDPPL